MTKITVGYVQQTFDENGKCVSSEFIAGDQVEWEDESGGVAEPLNSAEYFSFEMVQPE